jgi:diguanylate cyclase (GGDEF)-like protein
MLTAVEAGHPGPGQEEPRRQRAAATWRLIAGLFLVVALLIAGDILRAPARDPLAWSIAVGVAALAALAVAYHREVLTIAERQHGETESLNRMLQGLSRSTSPDAVLAAIVDELRSATGADHCVLVRRRPRSRLLEATLVSGSAAADTSTTLPSVLLDVSSGDQEGASVVAARISDAAGELFGLTNRRAAPLVTRRGVLGALVLSRRQGARWSPAAVRLLDDAAREASAALERAYAYQATEEAATTDALTGLPNRRFLDILASRPAGRRREDQTGVLMVDIDHFKRFNDRHGHAGGDEVLRAVADAIAGTIRTDDFPIRYGGEEFVVVLHRADRDIAVAVAERLRRNVAAIKLDRPRLTAPVTVSVGVAVSPPPGPGRISPEHEAPGQDVAGAGGPASPGQQQRQAEPGVSLEALIARADAALYRAKAAGRDRIAVA